ncbi:bifunctional UDP-N-acetylglucosamine diphosphorylase/glucosamine-1-phosphate N-acetyltransferase GlmU [Rickettsiales bacterium]|nr:bifunctional UDP-N-acetylglucosamine diphosphorylase/glucosamine-1-phosphate N-acetyltransferase GlmU [Rickettsiales bacterium]
MSNNMKTAIIILAAGKGTRMKSNTPKVLHSIAGKSMIMHVLDIALELNPQKIITVLSKDTLSVKDQISDYSDIAIQDEQLGTAHAVKSALPLLDGFEGNILILYADTPLITIETLNNILATLKDDNKACVLGFEPEDAAEYGRLKIDKNNNLLEIIEFKDAKDKEREIKICNSGVMAIKSAQLQQLIDKIDNNNAKNEYYLTDLVDLVNKNANKVAWTKGDEEEVMGINDRSQLSHAEYVFQQRMRKKAMLSGITLLAPETVFFSHDTQIANDVIIHQNVVFGPKVNIASNVEIKPFSHIEGADIASGCVIGPYARLRPGTVLENDVKIGNFVETKKSSIGKNSKISHLSYIGDSVVKDEVNIGAGTVTCNYDGYDKFQTIIETGAFVGSNTAIISPVKVGAGSIIGAGSVITKDVKEDSLTVSRPKQISKENWAAEFRKSKEN